MRSLFRNAPWLWIVLGFFLLISGWCATIWIAHKNPMQKISENIKEK